MTTLKDIARDCGISVPTASQALSGDPRIADRTRQRVIESAKRLGYSPNAVAQMLRSRGTNTVVIAYVRSRQSVMATQVNSLAEEIGARGFKLEVKTAANNDALLATLNDVVRSRAADAFLLWGLEGDVETQGQLLESLGRPFIARGYYDARHPDWCQMDFDHCGMMEQSVGKLIELGHERIGLFSHSNDMVYAVNLRSAFENAITGRLGRSVPREWMLLHGESVESGITIVEQMQRWFELPQAQRPTALAVGEAGSLSATIDLVLLSQGVRIGDGPGEFAIAGINLATSRPIFGGPNWTFDAAVETQIIAQMVETQLAPILRREEPAQRVLRYAPTLELHVPYVDIWSLGKLRTALD